VPTRSLFARARALDRADPLAPFRRRFHRPRGRCYLDGNSLGLLSREGEASVRKALRAWRERGVEGWFEGDDPWIDWGERLGARLAPMVGARADEVVATGSTTVNLHQLLATFYRPEGRRRVIVAMELEFPSDLHAVQGAIRGRGLDPARCLRRVRSRDGRSIDESDLGAALRDDVALVVLSAVLYRSGQRLDVARITRAAHRAGALAVWDLSHAIGAVPVALDAAGADAAVWGNYKFLNAGPGSIGGLFVARRHHGRAPGLPGWWGQTVEDRFAMRAEHSPAPGASAWQIGTIPVLAAAALWGSLDLIEAAGLGRIHAKGEALTSFLIECLDERVPEERTGLRVGSPRDASRRGAHVAIEHPTRAAEIQRRLEEEGIVTDFRPPDTIRAATPALTTAYADAVRLVDALERILGSPTPRGGARRGPRPGRSA
jgi:kynureninase